MIKSYIDFSLKKPLSTATLIALNCFLIVFLQAYDNDKYLFSTKRDIILSYTLLVWLSYILYFFLLKRNSFYNKNWTLLKDFVSAGVLLFFGLSFVLLFNKFYIKYIDVNFNPDYLLDHRFTISVILICIISFVEIKVLDFLYHFKSISERTKIEKKIEETPIDEEEKKLVFEGKNKYEKFKINHNDFIMAQAYGNYVMVYFEIRGELKKELLRNSLTELTEQLKTNDKFIRIHRSYLVNSDKIIKVYKENRKGHLMLRYINDEVPISNSMIDFVFQNN